jgi:hypothetical protein
MVFDTKTYWLTDRQSQCDFDVDYQWVERESLQAGSQLRVAVTEVEDSSGIQGKGNARRWKPLPSSAVKTVTQNTSMCVIVIYIVTSYLRVQ